MKKNIIAIMVVLIIFCFASVVLAAAPMSTDVPKDHWAYAAIQELVKDGIIDGFPDGTFRGDKTMTRYEMAQIVQKAVDNSAKATADQKYLIDKLGMEFALELNKIDTRVTALEKDQSPLKITGFFTSRYEWIEHPMLSPFVQGENPQQDAARDGIADGKNNSRTALWLFVDNKFDGNTYFHGLIENETSSGRSTDATMNLLEGYAATKVGATEVAVGRFFPAIGMGFFGSPWMDGARVSFGDDVKVRLFQVRVLTNPLTYGSSSYTMADTKFALGKDTNMSLAYVANTSPTYVYSSSVNAYNVTNPSFKCFNDYAVGLEFKGIPNVNVKTEYAVNSSDWAKSQNNGSARAYFATLKYKGANPAVPGSFGLRVEYKHADPGFDRINYAAPFEWNAPLNWSQAPQGGYNDNIKGFEYGIEYTVAPRLMLDAKYDVLKTANGLPIACTDGNFTSQNFASIQATYLF